ncbi:MAG: acetyl-CoA carboxyl transferase, partial [Rhodococcus sp.]|nr:acetyl-CoA carboxyl transferase [Rhodococcus sp. (in: high G+C Gram-positive bacteria)]
MNRLTARDLLDLVIDAGTWESWDTPPIPVATDSDYAEALLRAQEKTGLDESVLTGSASVRGRRVAIIVCEFGFLGGSIGVAAG